MNSMKCFAAVVVLSTATVLHGQERFERGRAFFQHVKVDKESYIRHLDSVVANGAEDPQNRSIARCERAFLVEDAPTSCRTVEAEYKLYNSEEIGTLVCRCQMRNKQNALAELTCSKILKANPNCTDAHLIQANLNDAVTDELLEISKVDPHALVIRARIALKKLDYEECAKCTEKYFEFRNDGLLGQEFMPHDLLGRSRFMLGKHDDRTIHHLKEAFSLISKMDQIRSRHLSENATLISECFYVQQKFEPALEWAKRAYELDKHYHGSNVVIGRSIFKLRGGTAELNEDDRLGIASAKKALEIQQNSVLAMELAEFLLAKRQLKEAAAILAPITPKDIDLPSRVLLVAALLSLDETSKRDIDLAKSFLLSMVPEAAKISPEHRRFFVQSLIKIGLFSEAKDVLESYRKLKPDQQLKDDIDYLDKILEPTK